VKLTADIPVHRQVFEDDLMEAVVTDQNGLTDSS
jgi:hypothetical protein